MHSDYGKLKECWVGRAYSPDLVEDSFVKDILSETEEDLAGLCTILENYGVTVKRPDYVINENTIIQRKPQLLHVRDHLQKINGKMYIGSRYEEDIDRWLDLLDLRDPYITMDNLNAPSIVRADKLYFDANAITRERYQYFALANPEIDMVYDRLSCRQPSTEKHTDGVFCIVKEGVIISTDQGRNLETFFPNWDILYLGTREKDLNKYNETEDIVWSPDQIPPEYRRWVGYAPESFFDVNALALDNDKLLVTRYNKKVFDFLEKHNVEPIQVPFRHRFLWDGGLHRMTFDYSRE
tara:strand:+ start:360 stop:1244 length:885 start_codon:yes stop_codon:yes gene_type:complete